VIMGLRIREVAEKLLCFLAILEMLVDSHLSGRKKQHDGETTGAARKPDPLPQTIQHPGARPSLPDVSMTRLYVLGIPLTAFVLMKARFFQSKERLLDPTKTADDAGVAHRTPCLRGAKHQDQEQT